MYPNDIKYSQAHTWVKVEGAIAYIGITHYAQKQLKDIVFANIYQDNDMVISGESFGTLESVKSVSDVIAPVSGKIIEINSVVLDNPEKINEDPYGVGMLLKVEISDKTQLNELMTATEYEAMIQQL